MCPSEGSIWRHEKTGHYYVVLGLCRIEASDEAAVRYKRTLPPPRALNQPQRAMTAHWIRPLAEFMDGRFTEITELPLSGRDQDLIDSLSANLDRLQSEARSMRTRISELSDQTEILVHQRDTLREDRNALLDKYQGDIGRLTWLEEQARKSPTGISFDYVRFADGGPVGWRFMRRHFVGDVGASLRAAIDRARKLLTE